MFQRLRKCTNFVGGLTKVNFILCSHDPRKIPRGLSGDNIENIFHLIGIEKSFAHLAAKLRNDGTRNIHTPSIACICWVVYCVGSSYSRKIFYENGKTKWVQFTTNMNSKTCEIEPFQLNVVTLSIKLTIDANDINKLNTAVSVI